MNAGPLKVLLVEDDQDDYLLIRSLLTQTAEQQLTLEWVATYEGALEALRQDQHDVYLVDYRLGERDGIALVRAAIESGCAAPMILLTGVGNRQVDEEAMQAGAVDYLAKDQLTADLLERSIRYAVDRKQAEAALREARDQLEVRVRERTHELAEANVAVQASEERFRIFSELVSDYAFVIRVEPDSQLIVEWVTDKFTRATGYTLDDLRSVDFPEQWLLPHDRPRAQHMLGTLLANRPVVQEMRLVTKTGTVLRLCHYARPLWDDAQARVVGIYLASQDITERRRTEEKLRDSERLATMGATVATLVHEIGNPLNGMSTTVQLLERQLVRQGHSKDDMLSSTVQDLKHETNRLHSLLQEMRFLSRPQQLTLQPISLATLAAEVLAIESPAYQERGIRIEPSFPADLRPALADSEKLKQVIWNLYKNAVEAMPEGGTLTVRGFDSGEHVGLEVSDTGKGIPEGIDIFELFTTTKAEGTGLGLAIVRQIMLAHNGTITYSSTPGRGTVFAVLLPAAGVESSSPLP